MYIEELFIAILRPFQTGVLQVKNGILKSMLLTAFILALLGLSLGCARKVPLVNPSFEVRSVEITTTSDSIKRALRARRWVLVRETPGMIVARYQRSAKVGATIQINYSKNNITIMLVESSNLLQGLDNRCLLYTSDAADE